MVPCSAGQSDAGAVERVGGCLWEDGDDQVDADTDCASVRFPLAVGVGEKVRHANGRCGLGRIHQKQVLALFGCVLPFALVDKMDYWAILVVSLVMFTLYGIDGIGSQLEDPFGYDRNDIKMDFIVEDIRSEISVLLEEWKRAGLQGYDMFVGKRQDSGGQDGIVSDMNGVP